ncbi:MAG: hypothetical protein C5B47_05865 [Verrucomicrobia bacterium]|nr:MAG: hypothetical protein C5B47_05865 [Verrucomicrobiota bacterium]
MPTYQFEALAENGRQENGRVDSQDRAEAFRLLIARNLRPLTLEQVAITASETPATKTLNTHSKLSNEVLLSFTEELVQLLEAGLPLERTLQIIEQRKEKSRIVPVAAFLRQQIREGKRFSTALCNTGKAFSEIYCHMVSAGEASGALVQILKRQVQHLTLLLELRRRVVSALIYPSIVFVAGLVLLFIFMTFLLPQLTLLLSKTDQSLPFMTRALVAVSQFLGHYWWLVVALIILIVGSLKFWRTTLAGRKTWDRVIFKIPLLGNILRLHFLAEFLQTLSTLVMSGIPLLQGLFYMKKAVGNVHLRGILETLSEKVSEGRTFSRTLRQIGFFPTLLADIVAIGEETGNLSAALERAASRYDRELSTNIQRLTTLIQPLTILIVALFVGVIAYSMIAGILSSISGLKTY